MKGEPQNINHDLLMAYMLGETDPAQRTEVEQWLSLSEENKEYLNRLEAVWIEAGKLNPIPVDVNTDNAWEKVAGKIRSESPQHIISKKLPLWYFTRIAAVLLVVAGFYLLLKMLVSGPDKVIFASNDKLLEQQLPDGSMISLNAHSTISYPEEFSGNTREINLTGEAFFSVVHRVEKPFIVYAGDMQIEVLGTEFNVNANEKSDSITVYVESGKVKFHPNGKETDSNLLLYLEAGDKGVYLKSSGKLSKAEKPDAYELFWLNKTLRFEETEVSKVIELLRKIYNVDIKTDNKEIQNCLLTATFHDDPIDIVLNVIAESFDLSVTMEDNTYTLHGEGCR